MWQFPKGIRLKPDTTYGHRVRRQGQILVRDAQARYSAMADPSLPVAQALELHSLITPTEHGIASRVLTKQGGGNVTLFAIDVGQGLTEHTSPFEAFVIVLEGALTLTVGRVSCEALPGQIVRLPAGVPHSVEAREASRMLLVMLRDASHA